MAVLCRLIPSIASCSRRPLASQVRALATTAPRHTNIEEILDRVTPREAIEEKRREYEEKYGDKLRRRIEACVHFLVVAELVRGRIWLMA